MRDFIDIIESYRHDVSPALQAWLKRWIASSYKIQDQISEFEPVREEAERFLNVTYPYIYRGLSITDEELATLQAEGSITIAAHRLQSWTKSRAIAQDYALPGHGGDVGVLVRKSGTRVKVVLDIANVLKHAGRPFVQMLSRDETTDAKREKEVIVETDGSLTITLAEVIKVT